MLVPRMIWHVLSAYLALIDPFFIDLFGAKFIYSWFVKFKFVPIAFQMLIIRMN